MPVSTRWWWYSAELGRVEYLLQHVVELAELLWGHERESRVENENSRNEGNRK